MVLTREVINIYSELNSFIDFIVIPGDMGDIELIKDILDKALDRWMDTDNYPDLHSIPIGEYLKDCLDEQYLNFEFYSKDIDEEDLWT